ncbi:MAG: HD domain-containing protein [Lachnospiraceae bacterium]|nr:HD domain-containing protein [Lachnospiraceae bacterium]
MRTQFSVKVTALTFSILFLLVTLFSSSTIPVVNADSSRDLSGLDVGQTAILYDSSIGMPTSEANTIAQTNDGFIWIGSYSGLVRYDGNNFYRYDSTTGITSVVSMFVDSMNRLWIGTNDNGLALFQNGTFTFLHEDDGLPSSSIRAICETEDGNIVVGTTLGLCYVDSEFSVHSFDHEYLGSEYIYSLVKGADGIVYGLTYDGDIFRIQKEEITDLYYSSDLNFNGYIYSICPDPDHSGYVYLGTSNSDIIYGDMSKGLSEVTTYVATDQISMNTLHLLGKELWIGSSDGIGYINVKTGAYTKLNQSKMNSSVEDIMEDYEGNLWFASSREGVLKVTTSIFTDINRINGLEDTVTNTTCLFNKNLYVGTDNGLLVMDQNYNILDTELSNLLKGSRIRSIKSDSNNNLWICTYSNYGLICLHSDETYDFYNTSTGLLSDKIRTVTELHDGTMCIALVGGVHFMKDGQITSTFTSEDGISAMDSLTVCENPTSKELYLGTDGDGLYILPESGDASKVLQLGLEDGLTSEVILRVKYDSFRDIYWIITSNSIAYMKDHEITTVTNFPYANNFDIFFDTNNNIWVLSSNGIYVVDADELMANGEDIIYTLYNSDSGLPHVTTANSRSYLDDDGTLYIAGTTGISKVNIYEEIKVEDAHLIIPFIDVDDETYYIDSSNSITIPSTAKRVTIYSYALSYTLNNPELEYYLEGFDEEVFSTTKRDLTEVTYTNLDGGTYYFHLSTVASEADDIQQVTVKIKKEKAIWEHTWFNILIILVIIVAIVSLFYLYFRRKNKILEKKHKENRILIKQITRAFAKTIDMKDRYTNGHSFRVANYTKMLAQKLGYSDDQAEDMYNIALLHDIGKLAIPDSILNKPERLNDEEYEIMKSHAAKGEEVLKEITIAPELAIGAGYHHERLDGKGYPHGYTKEEIPMMAQIIAVADTFDAMYSTRPYRKKLPIQTVLDEMKRVAGTQINAEVVEKLVELADEGKIK